RGTRSAPRPRPVSHARPKTPAATNAPAPICRLRTVMRQRWVENGLCMVEANPFTARADGSSFLGARAARPRGRPGGGASLYGTSCGRAARAPRRSHPLVFIVLNPHRAAMTPEDTARALLARAEWRTFTLPARGVSLAALCWGSRGPVVLLHHANGFSKG